jgi:hypothetical protein
MTIAPVLVGILTGRNLTVLLTETGLVSIGTTAQADQEKVLPEMAEHQTVRLGQLAHVPTVHRGNLVSTATRTTVQQSTALLIAIVLVSAGITTVQNSTVLPMAIAPGLAGIPTAPNRTALLIMTAPVSTGTIAPIDQLVPDHEPIRHAPNLMDQRVHRDSTARIVHNAQTSAAGIPVRPVFQRIRTVVQTVSVRIAQNVTTAGKAIARV